MTPEKELIGNIGHYFNRDMTEKDKKQMQYYISQFKSRITPEEKVVFKNKIIIREIIKPVYLSAALDAEAQRERVGVQSILERIADYTCRLYNITISQLRVDSPIDEYKHCKRKCTEYVSARQFFAYVAFHSKLTTQGAIGHYLGYAHEHAHTAINYLLYHRKLDSNNTLRKYIEIVGKQVDVHNLLLTQLTSEHECEVSNN